MLTYRLPNQECLTNYFQLLDAHYQQTVIENIPSSLIQSVNEPIYIHHIDNYTETIIDYTKNPDFQLIIEERASILCYEVEIPYEWAEAIITIRLREKPLNLPQERWAAVQQACCLLCDNECSKIKIMIKNNWTIKDIFGCCFNAPMNKYSAMGLVILLNQGSEILEIEHDLIKINTKHGVIQSYSRSHCYNQDDQVLIHELY